MSLLLDLVYLLLLAAAAPWLLWRAARTGRYREGWRAKLFGQVPLRTSHARCIWLHAVSVGEVNLLAPLLAEWTRRHADWECVISTTTQTGYAQARSKYPDRAVFYCPLDFSWAVRRAMRRVRPDLLVLAELELWPNLIGAARACGARVAVVNGRLSDRSFRGYRRIRWLLQPVLAQLDLVAAQNPQYAARFVELGVPAQRVVATGSVKFDGCQTDRQNPATRELSQLAGITVEDVVFLAGSTQEPEETLALETFRQLSPKFPRLRLILVPRHAERFAAVAELLSRSGVSWRRRTQLDAAGHDPLARVLLVDRIGELGAWWGLAQIAFVGGSLGTRGGQNMIEPAAYGAAVSFGPRTQNFRDVVAALLTADAAVVVADGNELTAFVRRCLEDPSFACALGQRARSVAMANQGATARTIDLLTQTLESTTNPASETEGRNRAA
jgi:3-deoxy-D-manno-octulosonic-acid transferase